MSFADPRPDAPPPVPEPNEQGAFSLVGPARPIVAPVLIGLNALWFVWMLVNGVSMVDPTAQDGFRFGANHGPAIVAGEWWRLLSAAFVHYGLMHLLMNLWVLWSLGPLAEKLYGRGGYLVLYLIGAIGCSCASVMMKPDSFSAGASGAVFATMGGIFVFLLLHRRDMPSSVFASVMKRTVWLLGLNLAIGFMIPNIDNAGHLGGLVAGIAAGWALDRDPLAEPRLDAKRLGAAGFLAVMLGGVCALIPGRVASTPGAAGAVHLSQAAAAFERSDWRSVEEHTTAALEVDPADADALQMRALARTVTGRDEEALLDCDAALRVDPRAAEARRLRADLRARRGEYVDAREDFERLVELLPSNARVRRLLGKTQFALGDARAAAVTLDAAVKLDERDAGDAHLWLWMVRLELGQRAEADQALAEFERSPRGEDLPREERQLLVEALGGEGTALQLGLARIVRALRLLHPAEGAPDRDGARGELDARIAEDGDPYIEALRKRIGSSLSR